MGITHQVKDEDQFDLNTYLNVKLAVQVQRNSGELKKLNSTWNIKKKS